MENIFIKLLNISVSASWLILVVIALRLLMRKAPKYIRCILWAMVGARLMLPVLPVSIFSLAPSKELLPPQMLYSQSPTINTGITPVDELINPVVTESLSPNPGDSVNPLQVWMYLAAIIWIAGVAIMAVYSAVSYYRLRRKTAVSVKLRDNIWLCDGIDTPFILGAFRPRIYIPSAVQSSELEYIEAHERAHLARGDHLWKPIGFVLLSVYWFSPLMWIAYWLFCRDIELACDERVIQDMDISKKKSYSVAMLDCSVAQRRITPCPIAFGEVGVKERVKNVLGYKKPMLWITVMSIVICAVVAVCFLTEPSTAKIESELEEYLHQVIIEECGPKRSEENYVCEAHEILGVKNSGDVITVYMLVMNHEYSCKDGVITQESGSHIPTVITVKKTDDDYSLVEYWTSSDGTRYVPSIREKFPWYLEEKAIRIHEYAPRHEAQCIAQAEAHFGVKYVDPYADTVWTTTAVTAD